MNVLSTPSAFGINDSYSYDEGSIGIMGYELINSISKNKLHQHILVQNQRIKSPIPHTTLYSTGWGLKKNLNSSITSKKILSRYKIDIITQPYIFYNVGYNPLFKEIKKYPFIISMCELPHPRLPDEINSKLEQHLRKPAKLITKQLFQKTLKSCNKLIAVNEDAKELYSKHIDYSKITVIPYGVNNKIFQFTEPNYNHNLLIVSRLIKRRNIDKLLEAMPTILNQYPDTTLSIIGTGPQLPYLKLQAKTFKLPILFYGNVTLPQLKQLYSQSSVYCHLSNADGWNQGALEAMSSGLPVVTTNSPHNSMINNQTGILLNDLYPNNISNAICTLFDDQQFYDKIVHNARQSIETTYNWNNIGKQYYSVYQEVLNNV